MKSTAKRWWRISWATLDMLGVLEGSKVVLHALSKPEGEREGRAFDRRHGTDTQPIVLVHELGIEGGSAKRNAVKYYPLAPRIFHAVMRRVAEHVDFAGTTFVDVGSGKGRNLALAATYPFSRIVGVEISPVLHGLAQDNLRRLLQAGVNTQRCECVLGDALEFALPREPMLVFLYYPFRGSTFREFIARIAESVRSNERDVWVVDVCPRNRSHFDAMPEFSRVVDCKIAITDWCWCLYRVDARS